MRMQEYTLTRDMQCTIDNIQLNVDNTYGIVIITICFGGNYNEIKLYQPDCT